MRLTRHKAGQQISDPEELRIVMTTKQIFWLLCAVFSVGGFLTTIWLEVRGLKTALNEHIPAIKTEVGEVKRDVGDIKVRLDRAGIRPAASLASPASVSATP
jgi:hypothetical protein